MSRRQRRTRSKQRRHERLASRKRRLAAGAGLTIGATLAGAGTAHATLVNLTVNSLGDAGDGTCDVAPEGCTLRDAVDDANDNPSPDTILFQSGLTGTIQLDAGQLLIDDPVEILGPGAGALTVKAQTDGAVRAVTVAVRSAACQSKAEERDREVERRGSVSRYRHIENS